MTPVGVALCADDYGVAPGVGRGIRALIERRRVSAVSCMTASPHWPEEARRLRDLAGEAEIGLHLTLTERTPLGRLIAMAYARRLNETSIAAAIERQIDAFEAALGRPPDFLDGHRHVHQLPVVRDALLAAVMRRYRDRRPWIRLGCEPMRAVLGRGVAVTRALAVGALGLGLKRRLAEAGWPANRRFVGVRDFRAEPPYGEIFRRFVARPAPGLLIMCHPGEPDEALAAVDPVVLPRAEELEYLLGAAFPEDLARAGATIAPLTL